MWYDQGYNWSLDNGSHVSTHKHKLWFCAIYYVPGSPCCPPPWRRRRVLRPPAIHVPPAHIFLSFFQLDIWEGLNCELSRRGVAAGIGLHLYVEDGTGRDGQGTPAGGPVRHPAPPLQAVESRLQSWRVEKWGRERESSDIRCLTQILYTCWHAGPALSYTNHI